MEKNLGRHEQVLKDKLLKVRSVCKYIGFCTCKVAVSWGVRSFKYRPYLVQLLLACKFDYFQDIVPNSINIVSYITQFDDMNI